jgi:hypothetical protein
MQSPAPAAPSVESLRAAVNVLANEDINDLHSSALGEDLVALRGCIDRLEAEFCRRLRHGITAETAGDRRVSLGSGRT